MLFHTGGDHIPNMLIAAPIFFLALAINLAIFGGAIYLFILVVRALKKYIDDGKNTPERSAVRQSLGETLKEHRSRCGMTQEFVAEALGVSRQAVSKWESGKSEPSTSNLLALARLYRVSPEELLSAVKDPE